VSLPEVLTNGKAWQVLQGDCLEVLRTLPDASVDAVITDPPYSSGGLFRGDRARPANEKYVCDHEVKNFHPDFGGDSRDQRSYGYWATLWLSQCLRITKTGGVCCLFTDWRQLPTTSDALQAGGWVWRGVVVWDKTEGARPNKGRFKQQAEFIVWGSKGAMLTNNGIGCLNGVFRHAPFSGKQHIAGKPVALMKRLVAICSSNGLVLDPFMGSGTTGVAALQTGRRFLGIELDPGYFALAEKRVRDAATDGPLFAVALTVADERTLFDSSCSSGEV
jgi:site-specific DNA-methyltransferase (adenine-specific)